MARQLESGDVAATTRSAQVRHLFDAVCDLAPTEQARRLAELTSDTRLRDEVLALVGAQTEAFEVALAPLHAFAAQLGTEELAIGDRVGHWTLAGRLGRGGMGSVFMAERDDGLFRQRVALKILRRRADPDAARRLEAERAVLAGLVHPGIARLYDGGTTPGGQPFLVMEHVDGVPLDLWMAEAVPGLEARLALFDRLCEAVAHAHRQLVVHCDLKPSNVLVKPDGQPMLLDFGIAQWAGVSEADGDRFCTPAYASPEQLRGKTPDVGTDVFALGVLLAELLADGALGRTRADAASPVPPPSRTAQRAALAWRRRLEGDLDAIVARATAIDPKKRYPDVATLRSDLGRYREHLPVRARRSPWTHRARLFLRRYRRGVAVATLGGLVVTAFSLQLVAERDRARQAAATAEQVSAFMVGAFDAANVRRDGGQRDPRASDVLAAGAERIGRELADQPRVQGRLLLAIGSAYRNLGQPRDAEALLAKAASLLEAGNTDDRVLAVAALEQQSVIAGNEGRGEEALALASRAEGLRQAIGDDSDVGRAESLNHRGLALTALGRFEEARAALGESLALRRRLGPEAATEVLVTLNNLARVDRLDSRNDAAIARYEDAIALARSLGSAGEPSLQTALDGLGRSLIQNRRLEEALAPLKETLGLANRLYGPTSTFYGNAASTLGFAYWDLGDLAAAEQMLRIDLDVQRGAFGEDAMPTAIAMNNLGRLLEDRGDLAAALPLALGSLAIRERRLAPGDPALRRANFNIARIALGQEDVAAAHARIAPYLAERLEHPEPNRDEWWNQILLGLEVAWRHGDPPEQVLARLSQWPLPTAPHLAVPRWRAQRLQGLLLEAAGRHEAARRVIEAGVADVAAGGTVLDATPLRIEAARLALDAGDRASARRHLDAVLPTLRRALLPTAPLRRRAEVLANGLGGA